VRRRTKNGSSRRKVVTYRNKKEFRYTRWQDQSPRETALDYLCKFPLSRIYFYKAFNYTTKSSMMYHAQKQEFYATNRYDRYQDFREYSELPGEVPYMMAASDELENFPWYTSKGLFIFLSIVHLGFI